MGDYEDEKGTGTVENVAVLGALVDFGGDKPVSITSGYRIQVRPVVELVWHSFVNIEKEVVLIEQYY